MARTVSVRKTRGNDAGDETRERLLNAAETLFAARGLDGVSVRDITELATANTAAIHYHFGSKQNLIAAILERRAGPLGRRREELLDALSNDHHADLRGVAEALVLPTAELVEQDEGGQNYVAFLAALGNHAEIMPAVIGAYDPYTDRYLAVLKAHTPHLSDDVRLLRFGILKDVVNRVLGQPHGQVRLWIAHRSPSSTGTIVDNLVDIVVGVFEAPSTTSPRPSRRRTARPPAKATGRSHKRMI
jgi:AcrR family transcriptional regulator